MYLDPWHSKDCTPKPLPPKQVKIFMNPQVHTYPEAHAFLSKMYTWQRGEKDKAPGWQDEARLAGGAQPQLLLSEFLPGQNPYHHMPHGARAANANKSDLQERLSLEKPGSEGPRRMPRGPGTLQGFLTLLLSGKFLLMHTLFSQVWLFSFLAHDRSKAA